MKQVNRERRAQRSRDHYGLKAEWIRTLPCIACGTNYRIEAAHAKSRGAGGTSDHLVPLCHKCHRHQHQVGVQTFGDEHGFDLMDVAADYHRAWLLRGAA